MFEQYDDILTVEEVADVLHIGKNRVYTLLASGDLKAFRMGRPWKIPRESVENYVRRNMGIAK